MRTVTRPPARFFGALLWLLVACGSQAPDAEPEHANPVTRSIAAPEPSARAATPNVILILVDTLRADRLGAYGHAGQLTPTLDAIAEQGALFENAIAQAPWTQPSIASLFSGVYPGVHGVTSYRIALDGAYRGRAVSSVFDARFATLAESLREGGYATAAIVANPFLASDFGFGQGFDHFDTSLADNTTRGSRVNEAALAWIDAQRGERPFFLYLHYMDVHGPYDALPRFATPLLDAVEALPDRRALSGAEMERLDYLRRPPTNMLNVERHRRLQGDFEYWVARYEAGVRELDSYLGALRAELERRGLWDTSYLIVTADHGEALLEHGHWDHGFSVGHAEVRVPLLLRWPGHLAPGERISQTVRLIDLMPTLLAQLQLPAVEGIQGRPMLDGAGQLAPAAQPALVEAVKAGPEQKALYVADEKLELTQSAGGAGSESVRLYRWLEDPAETRDRAADSVQLESLRGILRAQLDENAARAAGTPAGERALSDDARKRLEALGYIGTE